MRIFLALCGSLLLSATASCQTVMTPEQIIRRIMATGISEGHDNKIIGRMGDAAAVTVTKVIGGRNLSTNEIDSVLVILSMTSGNPLFVEVASDRQPRTTLFLLHCLDSSTKDPALKKRIAETRKYVLEQYAKSKQDAAKK